MSAEAAELTTRGQSALAAGRWSEAAEALAAALALTDDDDADAAFGHAVARWWLAETERAMRGWEAAYVLYRRRNEPLGAVMAAFYLCFAYQMTYGNEAAARGWLGRAARVASQPGAEASLGWVLLARAHLAIDDGQPGKAERWARDAADAATEAADVDLELCATSELGAALVEQGRFAEGGALLDEAMAGAFGGEGRDRDAVVLISCRTITASSRAGDLRRVVQWIAAADAFHQRYGSPHLYATCRAQLGAVLFATGRWPEAERELTDALRIARGAESAVRGDALATLAELRLAQGRVNDAVGLLAGYEANPGAALPLAMADLARGNATSAAGSLRRRLRHLDPASMAATQVQDVLVEAQVAARDLDGAARTATAVWATAEATTATPVLGRARRALGRVAAASGDPEAASGHLSAAADHFDRAGMAYEASRTRLLLASALAASDPASAIAEARAALVALDGLGAARDGDAAAALLRSLGVRAPRLRQAGSDGLTRREREVLELLGQGLSNPQIADRLFITRKTVEHHVASVLAKTGLSGRTEAAAWAVRHLEREGLREPPAK